jgi:hypothetical protein
LLYGGRATALTAGTLIVKGSFSKTGVLEKPQVKTTIKNS